MSSDDRKVWARDLEREQKEATLENIMKWMTTEMKSRMRASALCETKVEQDGT